MAGQIVRTAVECPHCGRKITIEHSEYLEYCNIKCPYCNKIFYADLFEKKPIHRTCTQTPLGEKVSEVKDPGYYLDRIETFATVVAEAIERVKSKIVSAIVNDSLMTLIEALDELNITHKQVAVIIDNAHKLRDLLRGGGGEEPQEENSK